MFVSHLSFLRSVALFSLSLIVLACSPSAPPEQYVPEEILSRAYASPVEQPTAESIGCAECHQDMFDLWVSSQHANANRLVSDEKDAPAFEPPTRLLHGSFVTRVSRLSAGEFQFETTYSHQPPETWMTDMVIGITPLRQYLIPYKDGRWQTMDVSYDPLSNTWFNAFGEDDRLPHEWGHWKGRSMTWNVQCAFCHMTGFEKNYSIEKDEYESTWDAMGISCAQCHGQMDGHGDYHRANPNPANKPNEVTHSIPRDRIIDNCASCHARREELFGTFKPGDSFHDHYRLTLPDSPGIFHADGQVLDEDFEYASFMMSKMGHKGVSCMDCHNPHSGDLVLPVENNMLCMQCHTPPGFRGATPIDINAHSFHDEGTAGSRCVDCHMPKNRYMVTDLRRDHGFTSPDPLLTIEHGIPNACNRCHNDKTPEWAYEISKEWYGDKLEGRARERARVVARAYEGDLSLAPELLDMAKTEEIDAWRAALVGLLGPWVERSDVRSHLMKELNHKSPLVRSRAINSLTYAPEVLLNDTSALVRVDAVLRTLERQPGTRPKGYDELVQYITNISDQPAGAMRQAQLATIENRTPDIEKWTRKAMEWDQSSALARYYLGRVLMNSGKTEEAISNLITAAEMDLVDSEYSYSLALSLAEVGKPKDAIQWLEETVRRDDQFGRAWYNLGLAYNQAGDMEKAASTLQKAGEVMTSSPDADYALATIYLRLEDHEKAVFAIYAALEKDSQHGPSMNLLQGLFQSHPELFKP